MDGRIQTESKSSVQILIKGGKEENADLQLENTNLVDELTRDHLDTSLNGPLVELTGKSLKTDSHLVQSACLKADAETQWTPCIAAEASRHRGGLVCTNGHENQQGVNTSESKNHSFKENHSPKKFSLLDIISDSSKGSFQGRSPLEGYAAFATEGIGEVKDQTPNNIMLAHGRTSMPTRTRALEDVVLETSSPHFKKKSWSHKELWQVHDEVDLEPIGTVLPCRKSLIQREKVTDLAKMTLKSWI